MSQPDKDEILRLRNKLQEVELEYASALRARGFEPDQDENLALPSSLAKLYQEREELRNAIAMMDVEGERDSLVEELK